MMKKKERFFCAKAIQPNFGSSSLSSKINPVPRRTLKGALRHFVLYSGSALLAFNLGCSSNPHKAKKIEDDLEKTDVVSGDTAVGVKDGNVVVQKKVRMAEELRLLQNEVYGLEDKVYGSRKFGSEGMHGALRNCRKELSSPQYGGDGKLVFTEPIERVTEKEEEFQIGINEQDKVVGVTEEFLLDRIARFREYKKVLMKREDEYKEKLEICDADLEAKKFKAAREQPQS